MMTVTIPTIAALSDPRAALLDDLDTVITTLDAALAAQQ